MVASADLAFCPDKSGETMCTGQPASFVMSLAIFLLLVSGLLDARAAGPVRDIFEVSAICKVWTGEQKSQPFVQSHKVPPHVGTSEDQCRAVRTDVGKLPPSVRAINEHGE